jgi:heterodisulfide reductase subunit C
MATCPATLEELPRYPEGKEILTCLQCGMCSGTCPYGDVMDYAPRRMIAMMRAGMLE